MSTRPKCVSVTQSLIRINNKPGVAGRECRSGTTNRYIPSNVFAQRRKDILLKVGILVAQRELSLRQDNWWEAAGARSLVRTKDLAHQHSQWPVATPQQLFARAKNSRA